MSATQAPREPDYTIEGGTAVVEDVVFKDNTLTPYTPSIAPTCFRVDMRDGSSVAVTFAYNGTSATGYHINDTPPTSPSQDLIYSYEWRGTDASKPPITGKRVVRVNRSWNF